MAAMATVSVLLLLLLVVVQLVPSRVAAASYPLTVHLVPHSHEDVGYEKTLDQYWYGRSVFSPTYNRGQNPLPAREFLTVKRLTDA
jgi:hypothetical protein